MVFKILKAKSSHGFTFPEVLISLAIFALILSVTVLMYTPAQLYERGRDKKRLSDLSSLDTAINEFRIDNERFPGIVDISYRSDVLPETAIGPVENSRSGWLGVDLSTYLRKLHVDPLNDSEFYYSYRTNGLNYELNAILESLDLGATDGGDDITLYELGDDLSIL